jgi:hypothetical protein
MIAPRGGKSRQALRRVASRRCNLISSDAKFVPLDSIPVASGAARSELPISEGLAACASGGRSLRESGAAGGTSGSVPRSDVATSPLRVVAASCSSPLATGSASALSIGGRSTPEGPDGAARASGGRNLTRPVSIAEMSSMHWLRKFEEPIAFVNHGKQLEPMRL